MESSVGEGRQLVFRDSFGEVVDTNLAEFKEPKNGSSISYDADNIVYIFPAVPPLYGLVFSCSTNAR